MKVASFVFFWFFVLISNGYSQCITSYPYFQNFESGNGGWISAGLHSDWAFGHPSKPVITNAASGTKCWVTGGLTGTGYNDGEQSYVKSPCFDFSSLTYPYIEFKIFWEMERHWDGSNIQYSLNGGSTWITLGSSTDVSNCMTQNWYNYNDVHFLNSPVWIPVNDGWSGRIGVTNGSCQGGFGSHGWITARHCLTGLAGKPNVRFRFTFGAGTACNNYDGFAFDDVKIENAPPLQPSITYTCNQDTLKFTGSSNLCPDNWNWNFSDTNISSINQNPTHVFHSPGTYTVTLTTSGTCNPPGSSAVNVTVYQCVITSQTNVECGYSNSGSATVGINGGSGNYSFIWNTNPLQNSSTAVNLSPGIYTVNATNTCAKSTVATIITSNAPALSLFAPNVFTPNKDGMNDKFNLNITNVITFEMVIYNRWGEKVFFTQDVSNNWDGENRGTPCSEGIYYWIAKYSSTCGTDGLKEIKGTVQLIR